jgi:ATP-dependent Clp protease ATP-binding subunit ClpA
VQRDVRDPLTDEILFGRLEHGGTVTIGVAGDELAFEYEGREPARLQAGESASPRGDT